MVMKGRAGPLVLAAAVLLLPGCDSPNAENASDGTRASSSPAATVDNEATSEPGGPAAQPGGPAPEPGGPAPATEDPGSQESPAGGRGGISIELAGLPVGGGGATADGDDWCQVLNWGGSLTPGARLEIERVRLVEGDATLGPGGCHGTPPCAGKVITADGSQSCAVLVRPASPATESARVSLDGTLWCPDRATCDEVGATDGATALITRPADAPSGGGTDHTDDGRDDSGPTVTGTGSTGGGGSSGTPSSGATTP